MIAPSTTKRAGSRYRPRGLSCNLGDVVDLSETGLRVLSRRQLHGTNTIVLATPSGRLRAQVQVVWHRRYAAGHHVHGLRFAGLTQEQQQDLRQLIAAVADGRSPGRFGGDLSGIVGAALVTFAFALTCCWYLWTRHTPLLIEYAPGLYHLLKALPEAGALLIIIAGGCALLGVAQRLFRPRADGGTSDTHPRDALTPAREGRPLDVDAILRSQRMLNCILESSLGGVAVLETLREADGGIAGLNVQLINPAGESLVGKPERLIIGRPLEKVLPCIIDQPIYNDLLSSVQTGLPCQKEYRLGDDNRWYLVAMVKLADGLAVTFTDTTEGQRHREHLRHIAYHDELTGLPNRKALMEHLDNALTRARRAPGHRSALLFVDFDRFKHINDTLGHEAGDQLLISIAQRLNDNLRETDTVRLAGQEHIPARLGGDEFVVLLDGITGEEDATTVARRLLKVFARPHDIAGQSIVSTASIGIVINDGRYENAEDILRDADAAMYTAKQSGKARFVLFDQDMQKRLVEQAELERDLRAVVEREDFRLVFEPIIELATGRPAGFEALIRWTHPEHGAVSPARFIPLAEDLNLIGRIGEWVVKTACATLADWQAKGVDDLFLNINLSRGQLYEPHLIDLFRQQLDTHQFEPARLRLELTETMVMNDLGFMVEKLSELKAMGFGLALDDFGTGYSSLNVLHRLPFDVLKIDRTFFENARQGARRSGAIIATITDLARNLELDVIAEGIAEPGHVAMLQALECRYAQGWHFSKPVDAEQALAMWSDQAERRVG